ncbi:MAG: PEGA domain-containing protein [Proteobacteria bacterium]|nr:PEGA domain-containing protein [Pseudomonadota bacterium]
MSARSFAEYTFKQKLRHGFCGDAFRAVSPDGSEVRITLIAPELARDSAFVAALTESGRALSGWEHPNVVATRAVGNASDGSLVVVDDAVRGRVDVAELLADAGSSGVPLEIAATIGYQYMQGLAGAHEAGIVHGALDPSCVVVDVAGKVRLSNFAIGQALALSWVGQPDSRWITAMGDYLAPELRRGNKPPARSSDVYSASAVIYHLLSGSLPPGTLDISPGFERMIQRALDPDVMRRYRHGGELFDNFAEALEDDNWLRASPVELATYVMEAQSRIQAKLDGPSAAAALDEATEDLLSILGDRQDPAQHDADGGDAERFGSDLAEPPSTIIIENPLDRDGAAPSDVPARPDQVGSSGDFSHIDSAYELAEPSSDTFDPEETDDSEADPPTQVAPDPTGNSEPDPIAELIALTSAKTPTGLPRLSVAGPDQAIPAEKRPDDRIAGRPASPLRMRAASKSVPGRSDGPPVQSSGGLTRQSGLLARRATPQPSLEPEDDEFLASLSQSHHARGEKFRPLSSREAVIDAPRSDDSDNIASASPEVPPLDRRHDSESDELVAADSLIVDSQPADYLDHELDSADYFDEPTQLADPHDSEPFDDLEDEPTRPADSPRRDSAVPNPIPSSSTEQLLAFDSDLDLPYSSEAAEGADHEPPAAPASNPDPDGDEHFDDMVRVDPGQPSRVPGLEARASEVPDTASEPAPGDPAPNVPEPSGDMATGQIRRPSSSKNKGKHKGRGRGKHEKRGRQSAPAGATPAAAVPDIELHDQAIHELKLKKGGRFRSAVWAVIALAGAGVLVWVVYHQIQMRQEAQARQQKIEADNEAARAALRATQPKSGTITITSEPDSAAVWLKIGRTPTDSRRVSTGMLHELRLKREGYRTRDVRVEARHWSNSGEPRQADIRVVLTAGKDSKPVPAYPPEPPTAASKGLRQGNGYIHIESEPSGAQVWLLVGITPDMEYVAEADANYEFKIERDGYDPGFVEIKAEDWKKSKQRTRLSRKVTLTRRRAGRARQDK